LLKRLIVLPLLYRKEKHAKCNVTILKLKGRGMGDRDWGIVMMLLSIPYPLTPISHSAMMSES
jgi:hypothetical protein